MDNLSQELVLARRDSGRLAKQLKVRMPPADDIVCATLYLYRYIRTAEQLQFRRGSKRCRRVGAFCLLKLLNPGVQGRKTSSEMVLGGYTRVDSWVARGTFHVLRTTVNDSNFSHFKSPPTGCSCCASSSVKVCSVVHSSSTATAALHTVNDQSAREHFPLPRSVCSALNNYCQCRRLCLAPTNGSARRRDWSRAATESGRCGSRSQGVKRRIGPPQGCSHRESFRCFASRYHRRVFCRTFQGTAINYTLRPAHKNQANLYVYTLFGFHFHSCATPLCIRGTSPRRTL